MSRSFLFLRPGPSSGSHLSNDGAAFTNPNVDPLAFVNHGSQSTYNRRFSLSAGTVPSAGNTRVNF